MPEELESSSWSRFETLEMRRRETSWGKPKSRVVENHVRFRTLRGEFFNTRRAAVEEPPQQSRAKPQRQVKSLWCGVVEGKQTKISGTPAVVMNGKQSGEVTGEKEKILLKADNRQPLALPSALPPSRTSLRAAVTTEEGRCGSDQLDEYEMNRCELARDGKKGRRKEERGIGKR